MPLGNLRTRHRPESSAALQYAVEALQATRMGIGFILKHAGDVAIPAEIFRIAAARYRAQGEPDSAEIADAMANDLDALHDE